ncbi:LysE family translocator [Metabacillus halosaccharovorans]|uniref:LysE family translocator n=1 Tax=Metabacillus halosaccharovorans TaxID=930124 RepID=UPI00203E2E1B|nr:LysE family translocator [Metabacillus halosaccharovorans]MCM3444621.1 LysE family translocator [Metabacillus halosaccharovorans]
MDITSFLLYCFIVTFTPGPTNVVILSTVHNRGTKKALEYTYGATIAFGLLLVVSAMLNALLIEFIPKILIVMQIIGTLYMFYLAYQIYKADKSKQTVNQAGSFMSGFLMQFLNPKVILFTLTVIPSFIMPYYTDIPAVTLGVFTITIIGFLAFITWVLFGAIFKEFLQRHSKVVNVFMALFLAYSGVMIWM